MPAKPATGSKGYTDLESGAKGGPNGLIVEALA